MLNITEYYNIFTSHVWVGNNAFTLMFDNFSPGIIYIVSRLMFYIILCLILSLLDLTEMSLEQTNEKFRKCDSSL